MTKTKSASKGGKALVKQYGTNYMSRIGSWGGNEVFDRYGSEYMSLLGELGADSVNGHLSPSRRKRIAGRLRNIVRNG